MPLFLLAVAATPVHAAPRSPAQGEPDLELCPPPKPVAKPAQPPIAPRELARTVNRLAPAYGLDPALVTAIIAVESGFQPAAVSPKNAQGLMQLIPDTASR